MSSFNPIDHKDSSEQYRAKVWNGVATEILRESIVPISELKDVISLWKILDATNSELVYFRDFQSNGIVRTHLRDGHISESKYSVDPGALTIKYVTYHCALTKDGKLVIFNGDASLCLLGLRSPEIDWSNQSLPSSAAEQD